MVPFWAFTGTGESTGFDFTNTSILGMPCLIYGVDYREDKTIGGGAVRSGRMDSKSRRLYTGMNYSDKMHWLSEWRLALLSDYELENEFANTQV